MKPTKRDYREAVCDLFSAIQRNPSILAALKRPEAVRQACDALLRLVQLDVSDNVAERRVTGQPFKGGA